MTIAHRIVTSSPAASVTIETAPRPRLSVITVTYGTQTIVLDMLASLTDSLADAEVDFEVVVVDQPHPTAPRTAPLIQLATSGVELVLTEDNYGFGGGCDVGVACSTGSVLAFVNPDVTFRPGWFEPLVALVAGDERVIAAPIFHEPSGRVIECGLRIGPDGIPEHRHDPPAPGRWVEVDYASAACWVMTRSHYLAVGGFDAAYHPAYYEDVDLALRSRRLGGRTVIHGDSHVVHRVGSSTPERTVSYDRQLQVLRTTWPRLRWRRPAESAGRPVSR